MCVNLTRLLLLLLYSTGNILTAFKFAVDRTNFDVRQNIVPDFVCVFYAQQQRHRRQQMTPHTNFVVVRRHRVCARLFYVYAELRQPLSGLCVRVYVNMLSAQMRVLKYSAHAHA